ncbi:MAG: hypothetical protein V4683_01885 [Bacteroidota bacterium]
MKIEKAIFGSAVSMALKEAVDQVASGAMTLRLRSGQAAVALLRYPREVLML